MGTRLHDVVVDAADPVRLGRFWSELLARPVTGESADEVDVTLSAGTDLVFVPVPEPKSVKNRLHLDLNSTSPEHQAALVARARELGARPVDIGQGTVPWVVLADPEGNEFCVLEPRAEYSDVGPVAAVVVDAVDPSALAAFWSHATGLPVVRAGEEFASLRQESAFWLEFVRVDEAKAVKNRVHLDVVPPADGDLPTEVVRLEAQGAVRADVGQGAVEWVVLADPEGNEFCVLTPR
ncbi:catechol-2,3-dioxygenase [Saccharothrix tamanrassetensis]|uniref:Catechol-2,3-dioxygenase n=1 Tax=Saccharothrix tamanrassetensis TaxID=1051531 RepID=A0A841CUD1_9PSEU|nr:VOC family protein [Saccharothrix tamanrassetensis]MBB5959924.1 catechol-2,3-dioxygenase [Saccharothrix tamanrassetensis]